MSALTTIALRDPKIRYAAAAQARKWPRVRQRDHILRLPASWLVLEALGGKGLGPAEHLVSSTQTAWPFAFALLLPNGRHPRHQRMDEPLLGQILGRATDHSWRPGTRARWPAALPPALQQPRPRIRPIRQAARLRYEMGPDDLLGIPAAAMTFGVSRRLYTRRL
jgi:hypothetical protein